MAADDDIPTLTNGDLARIFHDIGDMLEVKGELVFKTVAYHRAADAIAHSPIELVPAYRAGQVPKIAGVGQAISDKIAELARPGRLAFYDRLVAEVPPSLVELLRVPGVGPRTVKILHEELGIDSLEDLRQAAESGSLRTVKGLSEKTEQSILEGIAALGARETRLLLGAAEELIETLIGELRDTPGADLDRAGRLVPAPARDDRRPRPAGRDDRAGRAGRALHRAGVGRAGARLGAAQGRGPPAARAAGRPDDHAAGHRGHVPHPLHRLEGPQRPAAGLARDRGWSLSEKGFLRIGADGEPLTGDAAELRTFPTETEAYRFLDLDFIEPELREDRGEIQAAAAGALPELVRLSDLRGDLHSHSDWSDGVHSIEQMAEAARARGHAYQVLTDHSQSLAIARG